MCSTNFTANLVEVRVEDHDLWKLTFDLCVGCGEGVVMEKYLVVGLVEEEQTCQAIGIVMKKKKFQRVRPNVANVASDETITSNTRKVKKRFLGLFVCTFLSESLEFLLWQIES